MKISTTFAFIFCAGMLSAQATFQKIYGNAGDLAYEESWTITQTFDGGYASAGNNTEGLYFIKTNASGDTIWTKTYQDGVNFAYPESLVQTADGGYLISGSIYISSDVQALIIKTDANGNILWSKVYGTQNSDDYAYDAIATNDGGYIFAGASLAMNSNYGDAVYVVKLTSSGAVQWSDLLSNSDNNYGYRISQTQDGGYLVGGSSYHFTSSSPSENLLLLKLTATGNLSWTHTYGSGDEALWDMKIAFNGNYVLSGWTGSFDANGEGFMMEISNTGSELWMKHYPGLWARSFDEFPNGDFVLAGSPANTAAIWRTDNSGNMLWAKTYGVPGSLSSSLNAVTATWDGGICAGGDISFPGDTSSIYMIKADGNGNGVCNSGTLSVSAVNGTFAVATPSFIHSTLNTVSAIAFQQIGYSAVVSNSCTMGIAENGDAVSFVISPDPFSDRATLQSSKDFHDATLLMFNSLGEKVYEMKNLSGNTVLIPGENLPSGIYFIIFSDEHKKTYTQKVMITH